MSATPPTRWARAGADNAFYGERFATLVAAGDDVDGEARLADALLPRGGRVLDAGAGMGRTTAALAARGHSVLAVEPDAALVEQARRTYPDVFAGAADIVESDILALGRDQHGAYDLVVCVGNVMIFLAEGTERTVLTTFRDLLADGGRVLVGFHLQDPPATARLYPADEFEADVAAAGLRVDLRAGSYDLRPANGAYGLWVLSREG